MCISTKFVKIPAKATEVFLDVTDIVKTGIKRQRGSVVTTDQYRLTLIPQCEPTHLWKVFERLQADHSSEHFKADDGDLVLFDEARSNGAFLVRLLVNEA